MKRFKYLSLAALVAFAACDDGTDPPTGPTAATGTIAGQVSIEGTAASGVTVALSSGATTTTDANGAYSFAGVDAGSYTVSISGFDSDATFAQTSKVATIASDGQTVTVNFDGTFVRTSAILGRVTAGGNGVSGVTVSIGSATDVTDADGSYSFAGLRAGTYTVTVSGFDPTQYSFSNTSQDVTVASGESQIVNFNGLLLTNASVMGSIFLDAVQNDVYDGPLLEDKLAVAGVQIGLEVAIGDTIFTETDANGDYVFTDLDAGTYKVIIDADDDDLPDNVAFGMSSPVQLVSVGSGSAAEANFAFDVTRFTVIGAAFFGVDEDVDPDAGCCVAPAAGVTIDLYDTELNASLGGSAGRIDRDDTDETGTVPFTFERSDDDAPGSPPDGIVFLRIVDTGASDRTRNGEEIIEVRYLTRDTVTMAPDTFDIQNTGLRLIMKAEALGGRPLSGWNAALYRNDTSASATAIQSADSDENGFIRFDESTGPAALPDTFWLRLSGAQSFANTLGHGWRQMASTDSAAAMGTAVNRWLRLEHNGSQGDTTFVGTEVVTFTDMHVIGNVHHEQDDSTDIPTYTLGDNIENVDNIDVELWNGTTLMTVVSVDSGNFVFYNVPLGDYTIRARSTTPNQVVLLDTLIPVTVDGAWRDTTISPLGGSAGPSTFAHKYANAELAGQVRASDGTDIDGALITITPDPRNIQPAFSDTTLVIDNGVYGIDMLREGRYHIMASLPDSLTDRYELVECPATVPGSDNEDATTAIRDLQGNADQDIANFCVALLDTDIQGVVVNDRDGDLTVIDGGEALADVTIEVYQDYDDEGEIDADSLIATTTTNASGFYSFEGLREGQYIIRAISPAGAVVLRALDGTTVRDTAVVTTSAAVTGDTIPLPRWNYDTSEVINGGQTNFTFLFLNGRIQGTVTSGGGGAVANQQVILQRCDDSAGTTNAAPPVANGTCTTDSGGLVTTTTDASGNYAFPNLREGVYEVDISTAGFTTSTPGSWLVRVEGNGDIEQANFTLN